MCVTAMGSFVSSDTFVIIPPSLCPHPAPLLMMRQSIEAAYLSPECDSCHFKLDQSTKTWQTLLEKEG